MKLRCLRFSAALCLLLCVVPLHGADGAGLKGKLGGNARTASVKTASNRSVLPKKGDIAVVVEGSDDYKARVETLIVEMLVSRGYRVVNEAKMKAIRAAAARAKAARLALEGNVEGIMRISSGYSVAATVVAHVTTGGTKENEFGLFTGTATSEIMAVRSNGTKLGGKTAETKQVGYTEDETVRKAIDAVVEAGMAQMF